MTSMYLNPRFITVTEVYSGKGLEPLKFNVANCKALAAARDTATTWEQVMRSLCAGEGYHAGDKVYHLTRSI